MRLYRSATKRDLTVFIVILLFLLMNLGAIGGGGRRRTKEFVCRSNLRQWGVVCESFAQDNNGYFLSGVGGGMGRWWIEALWPYHEDSPLMRCPVANDQTSGRWSGPQYFHAWRTGSYIGSYGINGWTCNPPSEWGAWGHSPVDFYWRALPSDSRNTSDIPVFSDMWWVDAWPRDTDYPLDYETNPPDRSNINEMERVCVNRHDGAINCLFMDLSAGKVGLKGLWTLKWHREFNTKGLWTIAGGVQSSDWPQWMSEFKDY